MADGGVIIDDAGAMETRIWQHNAKMHERSLMDELVQMEKPKVELQADLKAVYIKYESDPDHPYMQTSINKVEIKAEKVNASLTISYDRLSSPLVISSSQRLAETDHRAVYFVGWNITSISINDDDKHFKNGRHTIILTYK